MRSPAARSKQLFGNVSRAASVIADGVRARSVLKICQGPEPCSMPRSFFGPRDWRLPRACMALRIFSALRGRGESRESSLPEGAA